MKEAREAIKEILESHVTHFLHYHDKNGRTTEAQAIFSAQIPRLVDLIEQAILTERERSKALELANEEMGEHYSNLVWRLERGIRKTSGNDADNLQDALNSSREFLSKSPADYQKRVEAWGKVKSVAIESLVWADEFFTARDEMNAKVHCAPLRLSPITERIKQALTLLNQAEGV